MDRWVAEHLHDALTGHPGVVDALQVLTRLGKPEVLVLASIVVGSGLLGRGRVRAAGFVVVAVLGAWGLNLALKEVIDRARPVFDEPFATSSGPGLPSGHAMTSIAAYGAGALLLRRRAAWWCAVAVVVLIGFTRVALGVHWTTDVLAGWAAGAAWLGLAARTLLDGQAARPPRKAPDDLSGVP